MADEAPAPRIYVLAGTNGGGKSSIAGAMFRRAGADFFDPDEAAGLILAANPGLDAAEANAAAWQEGRRLLERSISERCDFAFETTLGGNTIAGLLETAAALGIRVLVWYVGLSSPELHIERVRARVANGGHDIPDEVIRGRYDRSRLNLIRLMPALAELRMYDNSKEADPRTGAVPVPRLVLHLRDGKVIETCDLRDVPAWAKPILAAALRRT